MYLLAVAALVVMNNTTDTSAESVLWSHYVCVSVLIGKRPFGVSLLYMGWDKHYGFQLYQSDPSGNYGGWKATCIGNNSAVSLTGVPQSSCPRITLIKKVEL